MEKLCGISLVILKGDIMRKLLLQTLMGVFLVIVMCACNKKEASNGVLDEISGVWRAKKDGTMVSFVYTEKRMRMFIGDDPIPVTLGDIDNQNRTVNLNTSIDGKTGVWTVRQVWDKEHKSFHLQITLHDGTQDELSFVRKISTDDMNRFANAEAMSGGAIGNAVQTSNAPTSDSAGEPIQASGSNQNQTSPQSSWAPSFDCSKVSNGPERLICSNQELSEADVQLAQVYKAALKRSADKGALKQEQSAWLKDERNACSDVESMLHVYRARIAELSI